MAVSSRTVRIAGASLVAVVLIGGAYFLGGPNPFTNPTANAATTQELLKAYAAKDSDNDGLPDWEEALYGTDPNNPHSVSPTLTDGQAVAQGLVKPKFSTAAATSSPETTLDQVANPAAGTLTDTFAKQLFQNYMQQRGTTPPSPTDIAQYTQQAVNDLMQNNTIPDAYTKADIKVQGSGADALRPYAAAVEAAFAAHTVSTTQDDLSYFMDYIQNSNAASIQKVSDISTAYTSTAKALLAVPVPQEAAAAHLELVNSLAAMGQVTADMGSFQKDPLRALVGIAAYSHSQAQMARAFADMGQIFAAEQVSFVQGEPGYYFYNAMQVSTQAAAQLK